MVTGLSFTLVEDALTTDLMFDLWELGVALFVPLLMAVLVALATRSRIGILLAVAFLTLLMPVCGASFGASGLESLWQFAALGLVGGLVWMYPFRIVAVDEKAVMVIALRLTSGSRPATRPCLDYSSTALTSWS